LQLALPLGFLLTWNQLASTTNNVGGSFDSLIWGIGIAAIGGLGFIVALTRLRYRRPWAFWFAVIFGFSSVTIAPLSAPIGLSMAIYALICRRQFLPDLPPDPAT
jgi:hypothetical protein